MQVSSFGKAGHPLSRGETDIEAVLSALLGK
jgi:hypothetical protein